MDAFTSPVRPRGAGFTSPLMLRVIDRARTAAVTDASILLLGETGTGKEMLARAIQAASPRSACPFIPVNCGALPRELAESELFGFRRGAFTARIRTRRAFLPRPAAARCFSMRSARCPRICK